MNRSRRRRRDGIIAACLVAAVGTSACAPEPEDPPAPEITFHLLDDTRITLASRQSRPTLVVFFALNNPLALAELERLETLVEEFAGSGLELIAVAQSSDRPELVRTIMHSERFLFPVAMDADASAARAFGGVSTSPSVFLVSPDGRLRYASEGPANQHQLRKLLLSF